MSDIGKAIQKIAGGGKPMAYIGKARNVRVDKGLCDVEIEGQAEALDARLSLNATGGIMVVPKEGSDVAVVWLNGILPLIVAVAEAEEVRFFAAEQGGMVVIDKLVEKVNSLIDAFNSHTHSVSTTGTAAAQTGTAMATTTQAQSLQASDIEDKLIKH